MTLSEQNENSDGTTNHITSYIESRDVTIATDKPFIPLPITIVNGELITDDTISPTTFIINNESGQMLNPCEIEVPPFEDGVVTFASDVSTVTLMSSRISTTLAANP